MRSPTDFIVKPVNGRRYDNVRNMGGTYFIASSSKEDHMVSNRRAIVEALPLGYSGPIQVSDEVVVHHNVFKFYYDMYGKERSGKSFFRDDLFFLDDMQMYLYKNGGVWRAIGKYCFVKPSKTKDFYIKKGEGEEELVGTIKYINTELEALGLKEGDEVVFSPGSEYEFTIDEERLYRMYTSNIAVKL